MKKYSYIKNVEVTIYMLKKKRIMLQNIVFRSTNGITKFLMNKKGFGLNEILGIAAGIIIAALIVIPGLKTFAGDVLGYLNDWWETAQTDLLTVP